MKQFMRGQLLASSLLAGSAIFGAVPAFAQTTDQAGNAPVAAPTAAQEPGVQTNESTSPTTQGGDVVVTGTLIRNPNIIATSPVTVVSQEEIQLRQVNVAEQILRELPGAVPSIGSQVNNGNGGASFANLRGLGTNRNLILLDGARIAPAGRRRDRPQQHSAGADRAHRRADRRFVDDLWRGRGCRRHQLHHAQRLRASTHR